MGLYPGSLFYAEFVTQVPGTGQALNADSLPVAKLTRNGTDDATVTLTVTNIDAGRYKVTFTIPATYAAGDSLQVSVAATVSGVAGKAVLDSFLLDPVPTPPAPTPPAPTTLSAVIAVVASGPASVQTDAGTVTAQRIPDLLAADRYQAATAARAGTKRRVLFSKLIPAGNFPDSQATGQGGLGSFDNPGGGLL